ncbi:MAG TPA: 50S ribosomal protein L25 [Bdellovibrionales bacterium]|nr:50S ribosomal protein L25 [Bdellovibrionales bacterium]
MAREKIEIPVKSRESGKHNSRTSRAAGLIPGVVYGPKNEPINVLIEELTVRRFTGRKFESTIFGLKSDDSKVNKLNVIVRDVQVHPVNRRPLHVDFYAPDMTKPVRVAVELRLDGKPAGLSEGGVLEHLLRQVEIEVLPTDIPEFIIADVSELGLGDALHVSDLKVSAGVKMISMPSLTIATVSIPKEEEVAAPVAAAEAAPGAAPAAGAAAAPGAAPAAAAPAGDKKK